MPSEKDEYGSRYGKKGIGYWIVVYIVIAIILYGGYYLYRTKRAGTSDGTSSPSGATPSRSLY